MLHSHSIPFATSSFVFLLFLCLVVSWYRECASFLCVIGAHISHFLLFRSTSRRSPQMMTTKSIVLSKWIDDRKKNKCVSVSFTVGCHISLQQGIAFDTCPMWKTHSSLSPFPSRVHAHQIKGQKIRICLATRRDSYRSRRGRDRGREIRTKLSNDI